MVLGLKCQECSQIDLLKKETIDNEKILSELSIMITCLVAFLGHTDATGTTFKVTQVLLQCIYYS